MKIKNLSKLHREQLEVMVEDLVTRMEWIKQNDKTPEYPAFTEKSLNLEGKAPPHRQCWKTPYDIADSALDAIKEILKRNGIQDGA